MTTAKKKRKTVTKKTSYKKPTSRKKTGGRKRKHSMMDSFLKKVGIISLFLLAFGLLVAMLFILWMNQSDFGRPNQDQIIHQQRQEFINTLVPVAQRIQRQYGILTSVSLAQAALESNFGQSELSAEYYNLYGVKTEADDPDGVDLATSEFIDNEWIEIIDRFKVYPSWEASMESHAQLIEGGTSWNPDFYQIVLSGNTYQEQAQGLQEAGYATDPTYSTKLVEMIEEWELHLFDQPVE